MYNGASLYLNGTLVEDLIIPDEITEIKPCAFTGCTSLKSITLPEGLTEIGGYAFFRCSSLASITLPEGVTTIGMYAFCDCTSLASITLPESVTTIGYCAFRDCTSLASITLPEGLTTIERDAFWRCTSLTSITLPEGVTTIGAWAFAYCTSLASITLPEGVTTIGEDAFRECTSLASVYCKPTTPPAGRWGMFDSNASGRKIYVPAGSVDAYKAAQYWSDYASDIVADAESDNEGDDNLNFKRRVLMIQFTGTGCPYCPYMINMLNDMLPKEEVKNHSVLVAVHSFNNTDPAFLGAAGSALANQTGTTSYPTLNFDFNVNSQQYNSVEYNEKILTAQLNRTKALVGISATSVYDAATRTISLKATVKAAEEGEYRIGAWVIEDGIKGTQTNAGAPGNWKDYIHNNCVRYCDSKQSTYDYSGHDLGKIAKGATAEYNFSIQLAEQLVSDNCRLIVFVTSPEANNSSEKYYVNNVIAMPLSGEKGYEYVE